MQSNPKSTSEPLPLKRMHAVYIRQNRGNWVLYSADPTLKSARLSGIAAKSDNPGAKITIIPPNHN
jgi:hypothetical protein